MLPRSVVGRQVTAVNDDGRFEQTTGLVRLWYTRRRQFSQSRSVLFLTRISSRFLKKIRFVLYNFKSSPGFCKQRAHAESTVENLIKRRCSLTRALIARQSFVRINQAHGAVDDPQQFSRPKFRRRGASRVRQTFQSKAAFGWTFPRLLGRVDCFKRSRSGLYRLTPHVLNFTDC